MDTIGIGLAGLGTVGTGVLKNLHKNSALLRERVGLTFDVHKIAVRDRNKKRDLEINPDLLTENWQNLVEDPRIQIVVELMGGVNEPLELLKKSIAAGKIVVTANKALLAEHGQELFHLAREKGVPLFYEAAVAGGIPIIKAVRESLVGNRIESIQGILNGTSNYILTRMQESGMDFSEALIEAQNLGYAEADPALDINGWDAAHKAIILASLAYGRWISPDQILVEGIERVTANDIRFAKELGYRIKLLASIRASEAGEIEVRVCPTLIPCSHVLASVGGVFNAIWLCGDVVGETLFYGRGAGQNPTSSSVLADLVEAAIATAQRGRCPGFTPHDLYGDCRPVEESVSQYYLQLAVEDRPGVLANIAGALGANHIGISSVIQPEPDEPGPVPLILMLHDATHGQMHTALMEIKQLPCVKSEPRLLHVERMNVSS